VAVVQTNVAIEDNPLNGAFPVINARTKDDKPVKSPI
jgi:hypothetical protein